jgi:glycosyltransferase involved in cell wall biosynthesis
MLISFVIPFYNEEKNLFEFLTSLKESIDSFENYEFEIILINDSSTDNGRELVLDFISNDGRFRLIDNIKNSGQTACFLKGFDMVKGEYTFRIDSDLQDNPRDLKYFMEKVNQSPDIIMGVRENRKHHRLLRMATAIYSVIVIALIDSPFRDSGSFVGFKTKYIRDIPLKNNDHRYLPLIVLERGGVNIREVIVRHRPRIYGSSSYTVFSKIVLGFPELIFFIIRLKTGYYSRKNTP